MGNRGDAAGFFRLYGVPRSLLVAVWEWAGNERSDDDDDQGERGSAWSFSRERVDTRLPAVFGMWKAWRDHGILPAAGGWLDQPLEILVKVQAIDLVVSTAAYMQAKGSDWSKLTATQAALVHWIKEGE